MYDFLKAYDLLKTRDLLEPKETRENKDFLDNMSGAGYTNRKGFNKSNFNKYLNNKGFNKKNSSNRFGKALFLLLFIINPVFIAVIINIVFWNVTAINTNNITNINFS